MADERWIAKLFLALALLQLVPVWSGVYFPTSDGPSHVYNAYVMRHLLLGRGGAIAETYAIDWHPYPNFLGHVVLVALLGVFPAAVAEKLLVSAIILLFLGGAWLFAGAADKHASIFAFLALPFAHHFFLHFGFYNFCISAGLYLVTIALWWQRRDRPDWQTITLTALLVLLCYASHPLSTMFLIGSIGLLWLATIPGRPLRRHAFHLLALIPPLPLLLWFLRHQRGTTMPPIALHWERLRELMQPKAALSCDLTQLQVGEALFFAVVALMIVTLLIERRRGEIDAFLALVVAGVAVLLVVPSEAAGGLIIVERVALMVFLLPLPWLTPRLSRWGRAALVLVMSIAGIGNAAALVVHTRSVAREMTALIRAAHNIPQDRTMLALIQDRLPAGQVLPILSHAADYAAVDRRLVSLDNYEPAAGYFPIRLRDGVTIPNLFDVETKPAELDVGPWAPVAQYVFSWHIPENAPVFQRLERHYKLLAISKEARIYGRSRSRMSGAVDQILLPVSGIAHVDGPGGEVWRVDQTIHNAGGRPVAVELSSCAADVPCDFNLSPDESRRIAVDDAKETYLIVRLTRGAARDVTFQTVARRTGPDGTVSTLAIPSIPFASFHKERIDVPHVPLSGRSTLRVWSYGSAPSWFMLVVLSDDGQRELARRPIPVDTSGYFRGELPALFPGISGRVRVRVDTTEEHAHVWAFVTSRPTDSDAGRLYLP